MPRELNQPEVRTSVSVADLCRKRDSKAKCGRLEVSEAKRLKVLRADNSRLKRFLADGMLANTALKDLR